MRQIAIYGKGGIGKSTTSSNLTAAISYMNFNLAQVGCDPKSDSVNSLVKGEFIKTVSDLVRDYGESEETLLESVRQGFNNISCIESGGPEPGQGCAGRGVLVALNLIEKYKIYKKFNIDFVVYDVLGDIVCGGFAQPVRQGFAEEIYIVTSGEYMSLYAANNIAKSIKSFAESGLNSRLCGIIANLKNTENEKDTIEEFSKKLNVPVIHYVPRSKLVQDAEFQGMTVIEAFPDSEQAEQYFELAHNIINNTVKNIPTPLNKEELLNLTQKYRQNYVR
ncbi:MAG: nitrogenase iron protein NifH [bacterium]